MKVVMIHGNPYHQDYGGVEVHTKNLIQFLNKHNKIDLVQITFDDRDADINKENHRIITLKRMSHGTILFPLQIILDRKRLQKKINEINPDLVHIQSTIPLFSSLGTIISTSIPTIITLHGYLKKETQYLTGLTKLFYRFFCVPLEKKALATIPFIITVCPQIKDLIKNYTKSEIYVIPNGINHQYIESIKPSKQIHHPSLTFIGFLTKRKGVQDLIIAMKTVKEKIPTVKLYILGKGPYLSTLLQSTKNLDLEQNIEFPGFVNEEEKFEYLKSTDLFVLPTYWESFPVVLPEAMACEKPIITTIVAGNPFAVQEGKNGYLIQPGDTNKLAEKIIHLLTDEEIRNKMGKESYEKSKEFSWDLIAAQTKKLYSSILSKKIN